jgi:hypothetical protein
MALHFGRSRQSEITGFVHFHYSDFNNWETIPLFENFCFILSLFRTHLSDHALEAALHLEKIFHWQVSGPDNDGAFPRYIHEYPKISDVKQNLNVLAALFFIKTNYEHVLKTELRKKLEQAFQRLLQFCVQANESRPFKKGYAAILQALQSVVGRETSTVKIPVLIQNTRDCAQYMIAGQILLTDKPHVQSAHGLITEIVNYWSLQYQTYIGPCIVEKQLFTEPRSTLFDFFMAALYNMRPRRITIKSPIQLQAALVLPLTFKHGQKAIPQAMSRGWKATEINQFFLQYSSERIEQINNLGAHLFRLLWMGKNNNLFSLSCQDRQLQIEKMTALSNGVEWIVNYPEVKETTDQMECNLYVNRGPNLEVLVEEQKATVFELQDQVTIYCEGYRINLTFSVVAGNGIFLGHIFPGNRPAQKSNELYKAYDWRIGLRTIQRSQLLKLRLLMELTSLTKDYPSQDPWHEGRCLHKELSR